VSSASPRLLPRKRGLCCIRRGLLREGYTTYLCSVGIGRELLASIHDDSRGADQYEVLDCALNRNRTPFGVFVVRKQIRPAKETIGRMGLGADASE
jgi:hypothetical protein